MSARFVEKFRDFRIVTFRGMYTMFQKFVILRSSLVLMAITSAGLRSSIDGEVGFMFNPFSANLPAKKNIYFLNYYISVRLILIFQE